jgi:PAS domain S-box-containing protein
MRHVIFELRGRCHFCLMFSSKMKPTSLSFRTFAIGVLLMVAVFLLEISTGIMAGTVSYILIVLFVLWFSQNEKLIITLGLVSSVLILTGYFISGEKVMSAQSIRFNRSLTLIGVLVAVYLALRYQRVSLKEKKLREQLAALFRNANEGILFMNKDGLIILANPFAGKMLGYDGTSLTYENIRELLPQQFNGENVQTLLGILGGHHGFEKSAELDLVCQRKDGKTFPVEISLSHYNTGSEEVVIAFLQDVTNKKERERLAAEHLLTVQKYNTELEDQVKFRTRELESALQNVNRINESLLEEISVRKRVERELRKSQEVYVQMARNFPEGIIGVLNKDMLYEFADGDELLSFGQGAGSVKGHHVFEGLKGSMLQECTERLKKVYQGQKVKFDVEIKSDSYSISAVPLYGDGSGITEALVVIKNITPRKKVEKELMKNLDRERTLNMLKTRFVTAASHQFRTPLTTILSSALLLKNYNGDQYEDKKVLHLNRIKGSVNHLNELLNEFLSVGKLDEGITKPVKSTFKLKELVDQLLVELEVIKKEDQHIVLKFRTDDDVICSDRQLLKNILVNLLSNAIKYSPASARVDLSVVQENGTVEFEVTDYGIGIPDAEQSHIFERFFRAKNAVDIDGTGLGLNIVKKYVDLLGGEITFNSVENEKTSFRVSLPLKEVPQIV